MALLSIIRRWHLCDHVSSREIAQRLGKSRNTVRRYLSSGTIDNLSRAAGPTVLDGYAEKLSAWIKAEANRTRTQRRSLLQLHQGLCALGYTGSYDRLAAFTRRWRQEQQERSQTSGRGTFVPLAFAPGDAFHFDWSEDGAVINGERTKLQIARVTSRISKLSRVSQACTFTGPPPCPLVNIVLMKASSNWSHCRLRPGSTQPIVKNAWQPSQRSTAGRKSQVTCRHCPTRASVLTGLPRASRRTGKISGKRASVRYGPRPAGEAGATCSTNQAVRSKAVPHSTA